MKGDVFSEKIVDSRWLIPCSPMDCTVRMFLDRLAAELEWQFSMFCVERSY